MIEHYGQWIIRWRYQILLVTFLLAILAAWGLFSLKSEADYRVFFKKDNPELLAFDRIQDTYAKDDNVLFVLAPKDGRVFTRETLQAVAWLTEEAWQTPYSNRVDSITNFQYTYARGDDIIVRDLIPDAEALTEADITRIRDIALAEPQLVNSLVSPEGHVAAVNITIQLQDENADQATPEVIAFARGLERILRADYPHIEVYMTGLVTGNNAFLEISQQDMLTLIPAMFLMIVAILWWLLHSFFGVIATILVIVFSTISAVGLAGWMGISLTAISNSAPVVILTLAIANSVHILTTFRRLLYGREKNAAIMESLRVNFTPVSLVSLTTAIGFLSLNFGEIPPLRDLGNIVAIGVAIAFILSVGFLPALMATFPAPPAIPPTDATGARAMAHFGEFVIRRRRELMWSMLVITLALIACLGRNDLDDEYLKYYGEDVDFRIATDFTIENLTGLQRIHYSLDAGEEWGIGKPEFLKKMAEFVVWYREQPEVIHVDSIIDVLRQLNRNMHGDDPAYYRLPERRDLVAQYLLFYEMSLPYGLDLNNQINVDKSATRMMVTLKALSDNALLAVEARAQQWLRENAPASMQTPGVSVSMIFASVNYHNLRSLLWGAFVALVLISLILVVASRSVKFGLISMIPNLVPMAMAFGLWGLLVGKINLGLSAVALITMGIVVDDTIHFLNKYLYARRKENLDSPDAVRYAFNNVGLALWTTSLTLIAGFLILTLSPFYVNSSMGIMTAATITLALVTDFLLLPPLLMKWDRSRTS
uniref:SSD domain-containing protein n=1 Tax=Candidatus Kentrum sp. SD TaxID=2126332 RepID=A0A450YTD0_9GAMM|nr:MAG: hypothetical protein BECKSD772F_GA0070984_102514 [Candidatus Kentron sp. SD]VFK44818.1 MAG: hypothetical protein BECKSD772E_GA0070983_10447 [Candidatus Kentron sp. SD]